MDFIDILYGWVRGRSVVALVAPKTTGIAVLVTSQSSWVFVNYLELSVSIVLFHGTVLVLIKPVFCIQSGCMI